MNSTSAKPVGVTWVSPHLMIKDIEPLLDFYQKAFGFEILEAVKGPDGIVVHAELRCKDQMLMLGKSGAHGGTTKSPKETGVESPMNLYIYCEDVDTFYQHAVSAGAKSQSAPENMFWGDRMCQLIDPEGYSWCFATHLGQMK